MERKAVCIVLACIFAGFLAGCNLNGDQVTTGGTLSVQIANPYGTGFAPRQVVTSEFGVSQLYVYIINKQTGQQMQYIYWTPANGITNVTVEIGYPGTYEVEVYHYGTNAEGSTYYTETADVDVRPMLISTVTIVPGFVGTIQVTTNAVLDYIKNWDFKSYSGNNGTPDSWYGYGMSFYSSFGGYDGVIRCHTNSNTSAYIYQAPYAPLTGKYGIYMIYRIDNSQVAGDGPSGYDAPLILYCYFYKPGVGGRSIYRIFNIANDANSTSDTNFVLASAGYWQGYYLSFSTLNIPEDWILAEVEVYSPYSAGQRDVYVDRVEME